MGGVIDVAEADKTGASNELAFECMGIPIGQGSTRAFINRKTGRPIITHEHGGELRNWRQRVANEAGKARPEGWPMDAGIHLTLMISISRPPSLPKSAVYALKRPAIDKLLVAVSQGLTGILFADSSQIVGVIIAKIYCPSLTPSSMRITVDALEAKR